MQDVEYAWRGAFTNAETHRLHADAFEHRIYNESEWNWVRLCEAHSLGWVTARLDGRLVGFVNVLWDGLVHAWIQDEMVSSDVRRRGVGLRLVNGARDGAKAAGCEWLHVDFAADLEGFYIDAAGFSTTNAGLMDLTAFD